ncbi:MAG: hypothetical protein ABIM89_18225 [Mycobacteriales bacterium]
MKRVLAVPGILTLIIAGGMAVNAPAAAASSTRRQVRFRTPEAAMRYLASAYNRHDTAALKKVTNPGARLDLRYMQRTRWAVNLQLKGCEREPSGMASCQFTHDWADAQAKDAVARQSGYAELRVAPVRRRGWVMKSMAGCD